jgi:excisionase family DNA binding protein
MGVNGAPGHPLIEVDPAAANHMDSLATAKDIADGLQVPESWVRQEARAGRLPSIKLGHYTRFDRREVAAWLESLKGGRR